MSADIFLKCAKCNDIVCIGQRRYSNINKYPAEGSFIYTTAKNLEYLERFIFTHEEHPIILCSN